MSTATVSIVSHGHGKLVTDLLQDLSRQTVAETLKIVVTLNIPEAEPGLSLPESLSVQLIHNAEPKGFGANHNAALREVATDWVIVLNPDLRIRDRTTIARLTERDARDVGLIAPVIKNPRGDREDSVRYNLDPLSLLSRVILRRRAPVHQASGNRRFIWAAGMFVCLPRNAWEAVGGFDDRFFLYCEDYDLCARLAVRGYSIEIDDETEAVHDARRSSRSSFKYLLWHLSSLVKVWYSPQFWKIWLADQRAILSSLRRSPR